jgi:hypothetical protein
MRRALLLLLLLAVLAPATAHAQNSPFGPLPQASEPTPAPTATPADSSADQSSVSRAMLLGIAGGVALLFVGIGYLITRDARSNLTDDDRRALERNRTEQERRRGQVVKTKARARGKAQRQARKAQRRR